MHGVHPSTLRLVVRGLYRSAAVTFTVYASAQIRNIFGGLQAQDGRQGVGTTLSHFVQAIDPIILGSYSQRKRSTGSEQLPSWLLPDHISDIKSTAEPCPLRALASAVASARCSQKVAVHLITIGLHTWAVPGSHRARHLVAPAPRGSPGGRPSAPTAIERHRTR